MWWLWKHKREKEKADTQRRKEIEEEFERSQRRAKILNALVAELKGKANVRH